MPTVIAVLLIMSMSTFDIGPNALTGAWVGGIKDDLDRNHAFLRLNPDRTGRFVYVTSGKATVDFSIEPKDVSEPAGYAEITHTSEKLGVKIIVSGWSSSEDREAGLLTGVMYMYSVTDGQARLFNSIFLRLWSVTGPTPSGEIEASELKRLYAKYERVDDDC